MYTIRTAINFRGEPTLAGPLRERQRQATQFAQLAENQLQFTASRVSVTRREKGFRRGSIVNHRTCSLGEFVRKPATRSRVCSSNLNEPCNPEGWKRVCTWLFSVGLELTRSLFQVCLEDEI